MRKLLALARNHIRIEFEDRSTIVFYLVLPILFTVIIGGALGGSGGDNRYAVLVVDEDRSTLSQAMITALENSNVVALTLKPRDEAIKAMDDGQAAALVIIPAGFDAALMAGNLIELSLRTSAQNSNALAIQQAVDVAANSASNTVMIALESVSERERLKPFANEAEKQAYFQDSLTYARNVLKNPPARVEAAAGTRAQSADGYTQASAGQLITWTLTTLLGVAGFFVYERLMGTARRLATTPTSKATILGGNLLGRLALGLVQMFVLIGFGALVLKVDWGQQPLALIVLAITFALAATAFGVMLATFCKTFSQANGLSVMFSMLFAALGGCWWPLEITPPIYQTVVKALPSTWAMLGFTDVIVRGKGVIDILPIAGILLLFAAAFFAVGIRRLRFD